MKSTKILDELKNKTIEQLNNELVNAKKELFDLRLKNATNQLENVSQINTTRKNIARILTVMTMKQKSNERKAQ